MTMPDSGPCDMPETRRRKLDELFADQPLGAAASLAARFCSLTVRREVIIPVVPQTPGDDMLLRLTRGRLERTIAEDSAMDDDGPGPPLAGVGTTAAVPTRSGASSAPASAAGPVPSVPEVMTAQEAARHLRVSVGTVRDWAKRGILPCARLGRVLRFRRAAIERRLAWLEERR